MLGMIFGSFINVLVYRLPRGISLIFPLSVCPVCGKNIKFYDNIPVISFLLLKGKCRYCSSSISPVYPLVELLCGFLALICFFKFGATWVFLKYLIFIFLLVAASFTDITTLLDDKQFQSGIIPDIITVGGAFIGIFFGIFIEPFFVDVLMGCIFGFFIIFIPNILYKFFMHKDGMGGGDMKLFAMVGSFLGYKPLMFILFISSISGIIVGLVIILVTKNRYFPIPFAPFISVAAALFVFYGGTIMSFYLRTVGY